MLTGGRVLHHLRRLLPDRKNMVALVGYQAEGTRGQRLLNGEKTLRMHGMEIPVRAEIFDVHGLSAHADQEELVEWATTTPEPRHHFPRPRRTAGRNHLAGLLRDCGRKVTVPARLDRFDLVNGGWEKIASQD